MHQGSKDVPRESIIFFGKLCIHDKTKLLRAKSCGSQAPIRSTI